MSESPRTDEFSRSMAFGGCISNEQWKQWSSQLELVLAVLKESRAAAVEQEQASRVECNRLRGELATAKAEVESFRQAIPTSPEAHELNAWRILAQRMHECLSSPLMQPMTAAHHRFKDALLEDYDKLKST